MAITMSRATAGDAAPLATLRSAVGERLTAEFGRGHWSHPVSEAGILREVDRSWIVVARDGATVVGTLRLTTRKPWAIDPSYFQPASRPLYLVDMAVTPPRQRRGLGRLLLAEAERLARGWPADAIWLDAYDGPAGAGAFYHRSGYRLVGRKVYRGTPLVYYESRWDAAGRGTLLSPTAPVA